MSELRLVAWVRALSHPPRTRHLVLGAKAGAPDLMPPAQVLLLEIDDDGSAQLYRYTLDGEFAGDSWFESREDVDAQVAFEHGDAVGAWSPVPPYVEDAHSYAVTWGQDSRPDA